METDHPHYLGMFPTHHQFIYLPITHPLAFIRRVSTGTDFNGLNPLITKLSPQLNLSLVEVGPNERDPEEAEKILMFALNSRACPFNTSNMATQA